MDSQGGGAWLSSGGSRSYERDFKDGVGVFKRYG